MKPARARLWLIAIVSVVIGLGTWLASAVYAPPASAPRWGSGTRVDAAHIVPPLGAEPGMRPISGPQPQSPPIDPRTSARNAPLATQRPFVQPAVETRAPELPALN